MGSVSVRHRKILEELVHDCILYGLNENESLEYIKKRNGGIKLCRSSFYSIKRRVEQNESNLVEERMTYYARVGFAVGHFKQIAEIESENEAGLRALNLDTPFVKKLKEVIDKGREYKRMAESIRSKVTNDELPSSALVIDPWSIAGRKPDITPEEKQRDEPVFE